MGSSGKDLTPDDIDLNDPPFPLTAIDRGLLAMKDEDFHRITWDDLKGFIAANTLEDLKRLPSDLRRYLAWSHNIKRQYGGIPAFVIQERLRWTPVSTTGPPQFEHTSPVPFAERSDYAVLLNDWPYGFAPGITHICVWSKTPIATDAGRGEATAESRRLIEAFVNSYFIQPLGENGRERVLWFKNWVSLQSVRGVDHIHVLARDVPETLLQQWTERKDL